VIPTTCKRLIEVDFPIAAVSAHSAREKSIRHGHPSTLHLWWARRPLAACRAVLLGLLLPDPCDRDCPPDFKPTARELLAKRYGTVSKSDGELREMLLKFIGEFANWDHAANALYLEIGRGLVKAAHPEETPVVVDPFAGGGSIPLEALRLGCEAFASDLNPVACLILKTLLEDIPRYGNAEFKLKDDKGKEIAVHGLADALRHVGKQVKAAAEKELAQFYPPDPDGSRPIAYIWARTVCCEGIGCGAEIPLVRSFWLCKKSDRKRALGFRVEKTKGKAPLVVFEIFEPKTDNEIRSGTVAGGKATCPCCHVVLPTERVRAQLSSQRGGGDVQFDNKGKRIGGATLLAVVTLREGIQGRYYRLPTPRDYAAVHASQQSLF
jgi:adenine-specific DNA methylase